MNVSPTSLAWVTADVDLPAVGLVLPDALAATVPGSISLTAKGDPDLRRAYEQYAQALAALNAGDVDTAYALFVDNRCVFVTLYNRYYSANRAFTSVADPKEMAIDPVSVGCGP
jgi:hypothetical protein